MVIRKSSLTVVKLHNKTGKIGPTFGVNSLLTTIGMVLLYTVSPQLIGTVAIGLTINIAGSYMDVAVAMYAYLLPKSSFINPAHGYAAVFIKEREGLPDQTTNWRSRLRNVFEEEILPRLV